MYRPEDRFADPGLDFLGARFETTHYPADPLWGAGSLAEATAWWETHRPTGDECDYLDRTFVVRRDGDQLYLPMRPAVVTTLGAAEQPGIWYVVRADFPEDVAHYVRTLVTGTGCTTSEGCEQCPAQTLAVGSYDEGRVYLTAVPVSGDSLPDFRPPGRAAPLPCRRLLTGPIRRDPADPTTGGRDGSFPAATVRRWWALSPGDNPGARKVPAEAGVRERCPMPGSSGGRHLRPDQGRSFEGDIELLDTANGVFPAGTDEGAEECTGRAQALVVVDEQVVVIGQEPVHQVHHRGDGLLLVLVSAVRADGSGRDPVTPGRIAAGLHEVGDGLHDGMRHRGVGDGRQSLQHGQGVVGELSEISLRGVWGRVLVGLAAGEANLISDPGRQRDHGVDLLLALAEGAGRRDVGGGLVPGRRQEHYSEVHDWVACR